jgi:iron complex outermembrane receptor protein
MTIALATRRMRTIVFCCLAGFWFTAPALSQIANDKVHVDIPAQSLSSALTQFGRDTGTEIVFTPDAVSEKVSTAIKGDFAKEKAISLLLSGTGLTYRVTAQGAIVINSTPGSKASGAGSVVGDQATRVALSSAAGGQSQSNTDGPQSTNASSSQAEAEKDKLSEIVVTGTHIRGEPPVGSSVTLYTREDIDQSGAGSIDQFARTMTENFAGADTIANSTSNAGFARLQSSGFNLFQGAAFNLHGLGPSATLTLLNGQRLAPAGLDGSITDISQIPLSAIDHIEVLDDGASAIYGADAVAGVVNIITRKDFDGAETGLRYGTATDGGAAERTVSQLLGHSWGSGNVLLNYEFDDQGGLDASKRDYIPSQGGPYSLIPQNRRNSVFLSGNQNLDSDTIISASANYSHRDFVNRQTEVSAPEELFSAAVLSGYSSQYGATVGVDRALFGDWHAQLTANYSKAQQFVSAATKQTYQGAIYDIEEPSNVDSYVVGGDLLANGSLFSLPGGAVKVAVGASFRKEEFDAAQSEIFEGATYPFGVVPALHRHVTSAYGELFVPLFGPPNALPGARRLELSVSGRFDDYNDFGSTTNPKVGLLWEPVRGLDLRGSYGTSFRAPQLYELGSGQTFSTTPAFVDPKSTTPITDTLELSGGNPNLRPETSKSFTAGFDLKADSIPNLKIAGTYFHIVFSNQIALPPLVGRNLYSDPALAPFITRDPPIAEVTSYFDTPGFQDGVGGGPTAVQAIFDDRYTNVATARESGVDVNGSYNIPTDFGAYRVSVAVDRLLENQFQAASGTPAFTLLNTFGEPTKWKARGNVAWSRAGFSSMVSINHTNSYDNTLFSSSQKIDSWTTVDLYLGYDTGMVSPTYILQNVRLGVSVQNIADRRPPFVQIPADQLLQGQGGIPFDPANASPVGRLIAFQVAKRW